jgi:hypothetical protein
LLRLADSTCIVVVLVSIILGGWLLLALTSILSVVQLMFDVISSLVLLNLLFVLWSDGKRVEGPVD